MDTRLADTILAVVTTDKNKVGGGAPVFYTENESELEKVANILQRATTSMAHDLGNGVYILVKH